MFQNTIIEGVVIDSTNQTALKSVELELYRYKNTGLWNTNSTKIDIREVKSDDNGNWIIKFNKVENRVYRLSFFLNNYYQKELLINDNIQNPETVSLVPIGKINIEIINDPTNSYGKILVELINPYSTQTHISTCAEYLPESRILEPIRKPLQYNKVDFI
jgi:5-hydroxyisourate hydrolase-like protein (transthyretin family)